MGFLSALKNLLSPDVTTPEIVTEKEREALRRAWGLDPDDPVLAPERADQKASAQAELDPSGSSYDRHLWQNKMVRFATEAKEIAKIDFAGHVAELMAEHRNLGTPLLKRLFETLWQTAKSALPNTHISTP